MAEDTTISWTDATFNPWRGCAKVAGHKGCARCYAEAMSRRNPAVFGEWGPHGTRVRAADSTWKQPLKWDRDAAAAGQKRFVFCASLADVFEDWQGHIVDHRGNVLWNTPHGVRSAGDTTMELVYGERPATMDDLRRDLFALIDQTPHLTWLLLTKRPENINRMWPKYDNDFRPGPDNVRMLFPNVYLGYSASDQPSLEKGIGHLLACRDLGAGLFLSLEPLLSAINLRKIFAHSIHCEKVHPGGGPCHCPQLAQVIVGGESGPDRRPMDLAWLLSVVEQCRAGGVPVHVKQDAALRPGQQGRIPDEVWRLKEFPQTEDQHRA